MPESFLRRVALFDCLGDDELTALDKLAFRRSFAKDQLIILAEDQGDTLFVIEKGEVKVNLIHSDGKEFILSLLGEGEVFGELSLLDDQPRSANVTAVEDTVLAMIRRADFLQLMTNIPQIAISLLEELASRLRRTDDQVGGLALLNVHNRISKTILHLADIRGAETEEGILISERPTHQQLANMSGTTRETVTRVLKQLKEDGYIISRGRQLLVLPTEDTDRYGDIGG